ncbi:homospermidine synthase [Aestuariivirga litoralis]|uniref:homospermidine synthase n=1 Tax=Aestuariivirga litoralis TaxID=2650924 RepID=UPI0018C6C07E|nr:saccharopine dehydrogenase C-terminal domain-containing protein [Aestuariivirga litoralis]MBG1231638.1 homospermidine synthase [Aestuariivirga litoralis]
MAQWPIYATWKGPIVMVGLGSIGRGTLPLILRHIQCDPKQITIVEPLTDWKHLADKYGTNFKQIGLTEDNYRTVLDALLSGPEQGLIVNLSVDVGSVDMMKAARELNALYVDTVIEPWTGFYYDSKRGNAARTNYVLRENMLATKRKLGKGVTAVSCCGANPGMVSWFMKQALLNLAKETGIKFEKPKTQIQWAKLAKKLGVKGIHIAERDTQVAVKPKDQDTFVNTWSVEGFVSEGKQPAELGWGSHEKKIPGIGRKHRFGSKAAIYLESPGATTKVRSWVPGIGPQYGFLVTHNEAISISDYYTVKTAGKVAYRPTCHYAYHPCNDAVLSLHEMFGRGGTHPAKQHILTAEEISSGQDLLGVLLYGHKKNAYWYGSELSIEEARNLAPYSSATSLQVTSAVLAGIIWAIENPNEGIVETDEVDFERCLQIQAPYLGKVRGHYTDWTPLDSYDGLFGGPSDKKDPWQFTNILVST